MTLELIFGVEMGFPFYAKVESFCLLAAMMTMRSVCVFRSGFKDLSLSLSLSLLLYLKLSWRIWRRGEKKNGGKSKFRLFVCLFLLLQKKKNKVHGRREGERERERERERSCYKRKRGREWEEKKIEKVANFVAKDGAPGEEEGFFVVSETIVVVLHLQKLIL